MNAQTIQDHFVTCSVQFESHHVWAEFRSRGPARHGRRVPLLALEVYDRLQQRVDHLTQYQVDQVVATDDSLHLTLSERTRGITLGLWLRIIDGELSILLPPAELYEHKPAMYRLFAVEPLPGLIRAESTGQLLLPINTGVLCSPANKPALSDKFLIYGEQSRWELLPTLPVCAAQNPEGGLMAIAVSGAAETECRVATDGQGAGTVGLSFFLRGHDPDPLETCNREIRVVPIPPGKNIVVATAKRLRRHVRDDLGKKPLKLRAAESPEVAKLLKAYLMKLFYGVQMQGFILHDMTVADNQDFFIAMTFDEARQGLQSLHDAGVDHIYTQNVGWNFRGHDGAYPTRFPVEERVGGEKDFRALLQFGAGLGYQMTVHDNFMEAYESSPDFDLSILARDVYGQPQIRGYWGGGASYLIWPEAVSDETQRAYLQRVKDLGVVGPYYCDGMGTPLYINYDPAHGGTRTGHVRGMDHVLQLARDMYGSCATETGFLYCSLTPDLVANPGSEYYLKLCRREWPITHLLDQRVPLWQITMSGLVLVESQGIDWADTMRALLFGHHPRYEWSTRPGLHPVLDAKLIDMIKARYDLLVKRFGHLCLQQITEYGQSGKLESTTFEDGTRIKADFATGELWVNDEPIERPDVLAHAPATPHPHHAPPSEEFAEVDP